MHKLPARIFFYSHDGHGLGHLRMTLLLAEELARREPSASIMIATGAHAFDESQLSEQIALVKLPSIRSSIMLSDLRPALGSNYTWRGIWSMREAILHETVRVFDPHLIVGDNEPAGMLGELARTLRLVRDLSPRTRTVLGMNDCLGDGDKVQKRWAREGSQDALANDYDRVLIFGQQDVFDPRDAYSFPPTVAANTRFTGYLWRRPATGDMAQIRAQYGVAPHAPWVVIAAGGGEDGFRLLDTACDVTGAGTVDARLLLVTGPLMTAEERAQLTERAATLPGVTIRTSVDDLPGHMAAANAVVILGGYNSVVEAIGASHRPIIVPRDDEWTEQRQRAERLAELDLAICIRPMDLTTDRLTTALQETLTALFSPPALLNLDGVSGAVAELQSLLPRRGDRWPIRSLATATLPPPNPIPSVPVPSDSDEGRIVAAWDGTLFQINCGGLIESDIAEFGAFERDLQLALFPVLRPGDVVIDAGANIGCHTCPMAIRVAPYGRVIAIEPVDRLADRLEANCQINGLTNVTIERRVLAAGVGRRELTVPPITDPNQGTASLHRERFPDGEILHVETTTLDELVSSLGLDRVRLIKMDLEGEDFDALLGARATLRRFRPVIAFEYHPELWKRAGRVFADADRLLSGEFGYRLTPLSHGGEAQSVLAVWSDSD